MNTEQLSYLRMYKAAIFLFIASLSLLACGEDETSLTPTALGITANVQEAEEGEQFAITVRTDTPNRTGTDIPVSLIYEGIEVEFIDGSSVLPVIQQDQEFNSLIIAVSDDPSVEGDRELTISIDPTQVPAGLTVSIESVTVTITDK